VPGYEVVAHQLWNNYESYTTTVTVRPQNSSDAQLLEAFKSDPYGKGMNCSWRRLLEDMVLRGIVPPGNYLVEVFW